MTTNRTELHNKHVSPVTGREVTEASIWNRPNFRLRATSDRNYASYSRPSYVRPLRQLTITAFPHHDGSSLLLPQLNLIHQRGQTDSWTSLIYRRHIENDIVEVAGLEVWNQSEEFLESKMGGFVARLRDCCQVQIVGSGSDRCLRFNGRSKGGGGPAGKEWMDFTVSGIYIDKKNFAITGFRECGRNPGSESRGSRAFAKACYAYQLWFMGNSM